MCVVVAGTSLLRVANILATDVPKQLQQDGSKWSQRVPSGNSGAMAVNGLGAMAQQPRRQKATIKMMGDWPGRDRHKLQSKLTNCWGDWPRHDGSTALVPKSDNRNKRGLASAQAP